MEKLQRYNTISMCGSTQNKEKKHTIKMCLYTFIVQTKQSGPLLYSLEIDVLFSIIIYINT